jgi:hypothetical protein
MPVKYFRHRYELTEQQVRDLFITEYEIATSKLTEMNRILNTHSLDEIAEFLESHDMIMIERDF